MKLILYLSTIITLLYLPEPISSSIAKHSHNTTESEFPPANNVRLFSVNSESQDTSKATTITFKRY